MKHVFGRVWHDPNDPDGDEFWLELRTSAEGANPYAKQSWIALYRWSPRALLARLILAFKKG